MATGWGRFEFPFAVVRRRSSPCRSRGWMRCTWTHLWFSWVQVRPPQTARDDKSAPARGAHSRLMEECVESVIMYIYYFTLPQSFFCHWVWLSCHRAYICRVSSFVGSTANTAGPVVLGNILVLASLVCR